MIRVVPHWPRDHYLELAPLFSKQTRDRLVPAELEAELGPLTIPELLPQAAAEQQAPSDDVEVTREAWAGRQRRAPLRHAADTFAYHVVLIGL